MPIGALIGAGASLGSALLGRQRPQTTTQTQDQTYTPNWTRKQGKTHKAIGYNLLEALRAGPSVPEWQRTAGRENINDVYRGALARLEQDAARRGFGGSGVEGRDVMATEMARASNMRGLERDLMGDAMNRFWSQIVPAGLQYTSSPFQGYSTHTQSTGTMPGQSVGQALAGPLGGIGSDMATYFMMKKFLSPQATGGGYSSYSDNPFFGSV